MHTVGVLQEMIEGVSVGGGGHSVVTKEGQIDIVVSGAYIYNSYSKDSRGEGRRGRDPLPSLFNMKHCYLCL